MKNVKVILLSVVLCAAVFANSRTAALGGAAFWAGDRANIAIFPATINDHDFVELDEVGTTGGVDATILWGDATTWGFNFNQDNDWTWMNIMWGNGDVGLQVQYVADSDFDNSGAAPVADDHDGFGVSYGQNFDWGELGVGFNTGSTCEDNNCSNDESEYWANWRADMNAWVFDSATASFRSWDSGSDASNMSLSFDMFTHLDAGGADVLFGLGVAYATGSTGDNSWTSMTLPTATLAVEAGLTDWATLRAWASHSYAFSCTSDFNDGTVGACDDDETGPSGTNDATYGFGLGFDWGAAALDMSIGEGLFTDPVGTMNGWDSLGTEGEVTLSYSF